MSGRVERAVLGLLTHAFRLLASTWRVSVRMPDESRIAPEDYSFDRELFAIRERDLLVLVPIARLTKVASLVAEGKDGDRATVVADFLGAVTERGSSLHSPGVAAIRFCRRLRAWPGPGLLVVDGPVGPFGIAKPGVAAIASRSGREVRCVAADAWPKLTLFYLWSRMIIPLPFARVVIAVDERLVVGSSDRATVERSASEVTRRLGLLAERACETLGERDAGGAVEREAVR